MAQCESMWRLTGTVLLTWWYFHTGKWAEALLDGTLLASDWNIVVVTINYRLGVFGFLDFSCLDSSYIANPALHDIVLALKWTHDNIGAFGGDPDNITVVGESSGGSLASVLPVLDDATPLLSRLILMSGIPSPFLSVGAEETLVGHFLTHFHIKDRNGLRRLTDDKIMDGTSDFIRDCGPGAGTFQPVIDGY